MEIIQGCRLLKGQPRLAAGATRCQHCPGSFNVERKFSILIAGLNAAHFGRSDTVVANHDINVNRPKSILQSSFADPIKTFRLRQRNFTATCMIINQRADSIRLISRFMIDMGYGETWGNDK